MNVLTVTCQQFNVNDSSYKVLEISFSSGAAVRRNDLLIALDSSKAVLDIESEGEGFFYTNIKVGNEVTVGQPLYIISKERIDDINTINSYFSFNDMELEDTETKSSKIITKTARRLLIDNGIRESEFKADVITEEIVNQYLSNMKKVVPMILENANNKAIKKIAFLGAGQGLIQVLDIIYSTGQFIPYAIYDDAPEKQGIKIANILVKGPVNFDAIINDFKNGEFDVIVNVVSTSIGFRKKSFEILSNAGVPFANLIHPTAYVGFNNVIGTGNIILTHVSIGPCTEIGNNNFISSKCNIEHHNVLGNHCTFGPGVMTSGIVRIGDQTKFGTGIFIEPKISIGKRSIIASGCIINKDVPDDVVAYNHGLKLLTKLLN
jgi:acetyltransferase-like isoleucine patch superfamily enzyme